MHLTNLVAGFAPSEVAPHPLRLGRRMIAGVPSGTALRLVRSSAGATKANPSPGEAFPPLESVPAPAPIAMPKQDLARVPATIARRAEPRQVRRAFVLAVALAFGGLVGWLLLSAL